MSDVNYAGFWIRAAAMILDTVITTIIVVIVGGAVGFLIGFSMASNGSSVVQIETTAGIVGQLIGIVITWLYFALMESSLGQATLGKRAFGLRVTEIDGDRISFGKATGRYFAKILSSLIIFIGFFMAGWTKKKQGLHDFMASTLVVKS